MAPLSSEDINPALKRANEEAAAQGQDAQVEMTFEVTLRHRADEGMPSPSEDDIKAAIQTYCEGFNLTSVDVQQR